MGLYHGLDEDGEAGAQILHQLLSLRDGVAPLGSVQRYPRIILELPDPDLQKCQLDKENPERKEGLERHKFTLTW